MYDPHNIMLDGDPTSFEEGTRESVRPGCLVTWHLEDGGPNLLLGYGGLKLNKFMRFDVELIPIEIFVGRISLSRDL